MSLSASLLFLVLASTAYAGHLTYHDCNSSPNKVVHFENGRINPDPIHVPGKELAEVTVQVLQPVSGSNFKLDLKVQKYVLFGYINVPCVSNVGSCSYDICNLISDFSFPNGTTNCPVEITATSPGFVCSCPFIPGTYKLNPTTFTIPELTGVWSWLADGDYKLHATLTDTTTGEEVGCYDVSLTVDEECSGLSCIFG